MCLCAPLLMRIKNTQQTSFAWGIFHEYCAIEWILMCANTNVHIVTILWSQGYTLIEFCSREISCAMNDCLASRKINHKSGIFNILMPKGLCLKNKFSTGKLFYWCFKLTCDKNMHAILPFIKPCSIIIFCYKFIPKIRSPTQIPIINKYLKKFSQNSRKLWNYGKFHPLDEQAPKNIIFIGPKFIGFFIPEILISKETVLFFKNISFSLMNGFNFFI